VVFLQNFLFYFALFFIYSVIGFVVETLYVMITSKDKKIVDRGFLIGPYLPIYGFGAIIMALYLSQYKDNAITVFLLGLIICSVLEYLTSYIMELLFKTRWWDYSNNKFNLNGRICGFNSILFGLGGILIIYFLDPLIVNLLSKIPTNIFNAVFVFCFIIFISDFIISINVINDFKKTLTSIDLKKDSTIEFSKAVKDKIVKNHMILQKRLFDAFPDIIYNKINDIKDDIKEFIDKYDKGN